MAFWDRFKKRWAQTGVISEPTQAQQDTGFAYLGANPPSVELFNAIFQNLDDKDNWLYTRLEEVMLAAGVTPSAATPNQLLSALRTMFGANVLPIGSSSPFVVPPGVTRVRTRLWGGGGGGGGAVGPLGGGSGGGGGGYTEGTFSVTPGQSIYVTIGAGGSGAPGSAIYSAQPGGTTSFGSYASASGGAAGIGGDRVIGSGSVSGGIGVGGQLNIRGSFGGFGQAFYSGPNSLPSIGGGVGGSSPFGGSLSHMSIGGHGNAGEYPGGGGCGAGTAYNIVGGQYSGGSGASGLCILEW